jgi:hypothetical protein
MRFTGRNIIKGGLLSSTLIVALCWSSGAVAVPINIGDVILNGNFATSLASWTTAGAANQRLDTDVVNTTGGNAGFNNFFPASSGFAVLGNNAGNIGLLPIGGISSLSQGFVLPSIIGGNAVLDYTLSIQYRTVLDGTDSPPPSTVKDTFTGLLDATTLFAQDSNGLGSCVPIRAGCPDNQKVQDLYSPNAPFVLTGVTPGAHNISFVLNEALALAVANFTNTAAGIGQVQIIAVANVPGAVPTPGSLALLGLGLVLFGIAKQGSKRSR